MLGCLFITDGGRLEKGLWPILRKSLGRFSSLQKSTVFFFFLFFCCYYLPLFINYKLVGAIFGCGLNITIISLF